MIPILKKILIEIYTIETLEMENHFLASLVLFNFLNHCFKSFRIVHR
jgi:hypothetical protein